MNVPVILALGAIIVFAVVMGVVMSREKDPQRRAAALTRTGAAVMAAFTVIGGIFIGGFAMQDPGGTTGTLITLAWVVPMLILGVSAWFWPAATAPLLLALASAFIAACVWLAFDPAALSTFLSDNGPVIAVSVLALAFPAAILGLKVTALAGWLLVGLGVSAAVDYDHRKVGRGRIADRRQPGSPGLRDRLSAVRPDGQGRFDVGNHSPGGRLRLPRRRQTRPRNANRAAGKRRVASGA